jgi:catechol 2,3-dioxygenase-like lactoylglutathione lyase family enzyme
MQVSSFDHLVLTVRDLTATLVFYQQGLGMQARQFTPADGNPRWALFFGANKINLHVLGAEFEPKANFPTPGSADLCFLTDITAPDWLTHFAALDIAICEGPVLRTGAASEILSLYLRDPDGNLIEIGTPVAP